MPRGCATASGPTVTGPGTWTRVTSVAETNATVTVSISSLRAPLPGFGDDIVEFTVTVREPLADRSVVDGRDGYFVPRR
jgi:hypothetical protein